jgi:hypothetical protein
LGSPERHSSIAANAIIRDGCSNQEQVSTGQFVVSDPSIRSKSLPHALEAAMTLDDLKTGLGILKPGQMLSMSYAVYELVFPPGEPDELARTRAWAFAEEYGCTIKNLPSEKRILFLRPKPPTKTKSK